MERLSWGLVHDRPRSPDAFTGLSCAAVVRCAYGSGRGFEQLRTNQGTPAGTVQFKDGNTNFGGPIQVTAGHALIAFPSQRCDGYRRVVTVL
jgi:hypothetical protein